MSAVIPTQSQIEAAEEYALAKLCTEIPSKFKPGLTKWDDTIKACRITEAGCSSTDPKNPISRNGFTSNGDFVSPLMKATNPVFKNFWSKWEPEHLVMKVTKKSPHTKVCARANHFLYRWCEFPATRSDVAGTRKAGYTDVVPFQYAVRDGVETCIIPKKYCDSRGVSYNATPGKEDCYVTKGQKIGEFFASDVLVRKINASDRRLKKNIRLHKRDAFAPGIHVYTYEWNDVAERLYGLTGFDMGFLADDLEAIDSKYVFVDNRGYKLINIDLESPVMDKINLFLYTKETFLKKLVV